MLKHDVFLLKARSPRTYKEEAVLTSEGISRFWEFYGNALGSILEKVFINKLKLP